MKRLAETQIPPGSSVLGIKICTQGQEFCSILHLLISLKSADLVKHQTKLRALRMKHRRTNLTRTPSISLPPFAEAKLFALRVILFA